MSSPARPFWQTQPGLVWSNPEASDSVRIRAALLHPRFAQLLEIAVEFGLERLQREWAVLLAEGTEDARRASGPVHRILTNIQEGFTRAAS